MTAELELKKIVAKLEEEIVLWVISPGSRLVEDQLMDRFGAKRHVIRSAFASLSDMGLVERIPNRGSVVRAFEQQEASMLYEYRIIIEPAAAQLIPMPVQTHAIDGLRRIQDDHDAAAETSDMAALFRSNLAFHRSLFALCPNMFLTAAIERAATQAHAIRFLTLKDKAALARAQADHHAMIRALAESDREQLVQYCRDHLQQSHDTNVRIKREEEATNSPKDTPIWEDNRYENDEGPSAVSGAIRR